MSANAEVEIITPEIRAGSGGLADYTLRVMEEWRAHSRLRLIVPKSRAHELSRMTNLIEIERRTDALVNNLPRKGGAVLVQYSAYGFDKFGYPRWLLRALSDWKRSSGGLLVIMFHEIWTFWPVLNRNYLIQQLHRRDLKTLIGCADAVFTSTASQAVHLRGLDSTFVVRVLPVGSNITPRAHPPQGREPGLAILFGLQGARLRTLQAMRDDLASLARAQRVTRLVTVGGGNSAEGDREERLILEALSLRETELLGTLEEEKISQLLSRASFGISAQDERSITKSGTFMAYAAHGLNILSFVADPVKPEPICWLTHPTELLRSLSPDEFEARGKNLRAWQERTASWPAIANSFALALDLSQEVAATPL